MATQGERYQRFSAFLEDSFTSATLERFLFLNDLKQVATAVSPHDGLTDYSFTVVRILDQLGRIDERFIDRLSQEFPAKRGQVQTIAQLWLSESPAVVEPARASTGARSDGRPEPVEAASTPAGRQDGMRGDGPRPPGPRRGPLRKGLVSLGAGGAVLLLLFLLGYAVHQGFRTARNGDIRQPDAAIG
jgi:hypothetical protein